MYNTAEMKLILNNMIIDNKIIYNHIKDHNKEQKLDFDTQVLGGCGASFDRENYVFLLYLGIPIGIIEYKDERGNLVVSDKDEPIGKVCHCYKPINSLEEYEKYLKINPFPQIFVNPEYLSKKETRNILYCLQHSNNKEIFDYNTRSKLQFETLCAIPLTYKKAMKIFNKYFDKSIQRKFIFEYKVDRDRFYYLSGLKELVPPEKKKNNHERDER